MQNPTPNEDPETPSREDKGKGKEATIPYSNDEASAASPPHVDISQATVPSDYSNVNESEADDHDEEEEAYFQQDLGDDDSAYGASIDANDATTLMSSITRYRVENGRTYHSYGTTEYWGPNDEKAKDQQDLSHHFWTLLLNDEFYLAPVTNPQKILDIGCGTGIWVIDVAERFPSAVVKGIDVSPIQPSWVPPNARFEVDDFNLEWENDGEQYDLIHMRELLGGWISCCEPTVFLDSQFVKLPANHAYYMWPKLFAEVGSKCGMRFDIAHELKHWAEEAGFVNVAERKYPVAVGGWPKDPRQKELGVWNQLRLDAGMRDFTERRMRNTMKWEEDEIDVLVALMRTAIKNPRLCANGHVYFVCAQKPGGVK